VSYKADRHKRSRTHGNTIDFRIICLIIVFIHSLRPNSEGGTDPKTILVWGFQHHDNHAVNDVHGRNNCREIRGASRKE